MSKSNLLFTVTFMLFSISLFSQNIEIRKATGPIKIDGILDEPAWMDADSAYNFMQQFPTDSLLSESPTVARILYDDQFIYISAVLMNIDPDRTYMTPSLRRDFFGDGADSFTVLFDPFEDNTNAVMFGINPFGVAREGLISNGGRFNSSTRRTGGGAFSLDWDNKWVGEAKQYDGYWVAEMAIPFSTLRFGENQSQWNVNFYRVDSENGEKSTWSPIPINQSIISLATMKKLVWDEPTKKPGTNISFIPYVSAGSTKNFENPELSNDSFEGGFDLKYAVTPGLNLDLTVNPDFSQVEVDQQQTNLDRFELFFPEKRQFFLENADLFGSYGNSGTRPFFSRRIGVAVDESTGQNVQTPIPAGVRLSGKITDNLRLGFLSMQAAGDNTIGLPSYNFSMLSLQQQVFERSNVSFMFVNKETFESENDFDNTEYNVYNRTFGMEYNLASIDATWNGKLFYHRSIDEVQLENPYAGGIELAYTTAKWSSNFKFQSVGSNYNPEVGFVRRTDILQFGGTTKYMMYPSSGSIQKHGPGFNYDFVGNDRYGLLDWDVNLLYDINWRNTSRFSFRLRRQYVYLTNAFDPSGLGRPPLAADTEYYNNLFIASYTSDQRKKFNVRLNTRSGGYFTGQKWNLAGDINYRYQPLGFTSLNFSYNHILLEGQNAANLFLIGPRFDFTFTKALFWTTFVQYNSQIENLNINSRLQWRFAPVSDLFLVYTDNYNATADGNFVDIGASKARAIVIKLTYWLNF
jgi:Domain of unknown function (DUF5916)